MPHELRKKRIWERVIWPVLWPLLLAQFVLVLLCLLVGMVMWWTMPLYVSWSTAGGMMLLLLLGTGLNMWAFLVLLGARLKRQEDQFNHELLELEQMMSELRRQRQDAPNVLESSFTPAAAEPLERLRNISKSLRELMEVIPLVASAQSGQGKEQALLSDIQQHQHQLEQVLAGRERAREESRLKTGYLSVLQGEIDKLMEYLEGREQQDLAEECRQMVLHMRAQLADISMLLSSLGDDNAGTMETPSAAAAPRASKEPIIAPQAGRGRLKLLVVDDGPVNLMLARQLLERQGFEVDSVTSGYQALERQKSTHFDLVFMDIFMPSMDGMQTSRLWRAAEQASGRRSSILVALTANIDQAGREQCREAGLDDLLAKPYQPQALLQMVEKWFPAKDKETPQA
ncbi:response regulator [Halomonas sp. Bachu 37]|uniref:response regulator n=1 Tax=Halomonas kashgarensis TaxID=3084920 RepID=UPI003216F984